MEALEGSLDDFFTPEKVSGYSYTDIDCLDISAHLIADGLDEWAKIPRIYVVLRLLSKVDAMKDFVRLGINDLCLPFERASQLPRCLGSSRDLFIERQASVLTTAITFEKGLSQQKHLHLPKDMDFPYVTLGPLGQGRYEVDKVRSPLSRELFARKRFKRLQMAKTIQKDFINELNILKRIDHEHCVQLVASYTDSKYFGLLMSPVAKYNLSEFLNHSEQNQASRAVLGTFFGCLASAVMYLHQNKIRHRDIKPDNILIKETQVYLADFGISLDWEHLSGSTTTEESGRTLAYCAPEVAEKFQKRNSATDVWSLGCVFMEMLVVVKGYTVRDLKMAFHQHSESRLFYQNTPVVYEWTDKKIPMPRPIDMGQSISQLIKAMLAVDAKERPSAQTVYHVLSTFRIRGGGLENPYCGKCCIAEPGVEKDILETISLVEPLGLTASSSITFIDQPAVTFGTNALALLPQAPISSNSIPALGSDSAIDQTHSFEARLEPSQLPSNLQADTSSVDAMLTESEHSAEQSFSFLTVTDPRIGTAIPSLTPKLTKAPGNVPRKDFVGRLPLYPKAFEDTEFEPWDVRNLEGHFPRISPIDWVYPDTLHEAVFNDDAFNIYIQQTHKDLYERFREPNSNDFLSILHMLFYNGLDFNIMWEFASTSVATPIIAIICGERAAGHQSWTSSPIRMDLIRLIMAFHGLGGEIYDGTRLEIPNLKVASYGSLPGPLCVALIKQERSIFYALLHYGANPNETFHPLDLYTNPWRHETNVLMLASALGDLPAVRELLCYDANNKINAFPDNHSALHWAVQHRQHECARVLLETGKYNAVLGMRNFKKDTILGEAVREGQASIVRLLISHGANPRDSSDAMCVSSGDHIPVEPLIVAATLNHLDVVRVLVEFGRVHPDAHPFGGQRALAFTATVSKKSEVGRYLISKGGTPLGLMEKGLKDRYIM